MKSLTASIPEQVEKLLALEPGWDSYNGAAPNPEVVQKAAELATAMESHFSYPPSLTPLSDGNVQVEWHCDGWDIEVYVAQHRRTTEMEILE